MAVNLPRVVSIDKKLASARHSKHTGPGIGTLLSVYCKRGSKLFATIFANLDHFDNFCTRLTCRNEFCTSYLPTSPCVARYRAK